MNTKFQAATVQEICQLRRLGGVFMRAADELEDAMRLSTHNLDPVLLQEEAEDQWKEEGR